MSNGNNNESDVVVVAKRPRSDGTSPKSDIVGFFGGRSVFVTGGSGYLGRVLLFKLLSCCPDIGKVRALVLHSQFSIAVKLSTCFYLVPTSPRVTLD